MPVEAHLPDTLLIQTLTVKTLRSPSTRDIVLAPASDLLRALVDTLPLEMDLEAVERVIAETVDLVVVAVEMEDTEAAAVVDLEAVAVVMDMGAVVVDMEAMVVAMDIAAMEVAMDTATTDHR